MWEPTAASLHREWEFRRHISHFRGLEKMICRPFSAISLCSTSAATADQRRRSVGQILPMWEPTAASLRREWEAAQFKQDQAEAEHGRRYTNPETRDPKLSTPIPIPTI